MDEFSSKKACVTTPKMKIFQKCLDEQRLIAQNPLVGFNFISYLLANHGKLIQKFFWNFHFRVVTQGVLLENSSIKNHEYLSVFFLILERHTDRFSGKLIQSKCYISYISQKIPVKKYSQVSVKKIKWMSFPVKRPVWRPGKWKFQKYFWMSFPCQ